MNLAPLLLVSGLCLFFTLAVYFLRDRLQAAAPVTERNETRPSGRREHLD